MLEPGAGPKSVSASGLFAAYGSTQVLQDVDLDVIAGETMSLLGPSGCGKTTLLRCIAGLERPTAGTIAIGDNTVSGPGTWTSPDKRGVGMVFQHSALFPHLDVARNVGFGLGRSGQTSGRVDEMLDLVGLCGLGSRMPSELSGGQQQRVALARALAPSPRVLLLDEPFSSLDASLRAALRTEIRSVLDEVGVTALFVTHDQDEAFVMGDRVAVLNEGQIEQVATPRELYKTPGSPWVASFVGEANLISAEGAGDVVVTALGSHPVENPTTGSAELLIRPEQLTLAPGDGATIARTEYFGHTTRYAVRLDSGETVVVRSSGQPRFEPGDTVVVLVDPDTSLTAWPTQRADRASR